MRTDKKMVVAMITVAFMVMVIGGVMIGSEDASGATEVNLYASDVTTDSVRLTWTETEDWLFDHYEVYMDDGTGWLLLTTFQSKYSLEYEVTGLDSGTQYRFVVRDVDALGAADSNVVVITTEAGFLGIPIVTILAIIFVIVIVVIVVAIGVAISRKKSPPPQQQYPPEQPPSQ